MIDNKYELTNVLGKGGSAKVFLAKNRDGQQVAVKVIAPGKQISRRAAQFITSTEHAILSRLNDHPNVIKAIECNTDGVVEFDGKKEIVSYNVLEYAENGVLSNYVRICGPMEEEIARFFGVQLAYAISYMHNNGFAHLDIKLENVLLDTNFNLKLADLGSAVDVSSTADM